MSFSSSPPGYKLFFFVGCEEQKELKERNKKQELNTFLIRFHTNITTDDEWQSRNGAAIQKCNFIIASHNGKLHVNNITNTGSLFSISLPGKMISDAIR